MEWISSLKDRYVNCCGRRGIGYCHWKTDIIFAFGNGCWYDVGIKDIESGYIVRWGLKGWKEGSLTTSTGVGRCEDTWRLLEQRSSAIGFELCYQFVSIRQSACAHHPRKWDQSLVDSAESKASWHSWYGREVGRLERSCAISRLVQVPGPEV